MRLNDLLALSHVPRWSTVRHHGTQSVAEHTYRVGVIYVELCERLREPITAHGLLRVMYHDGAEAWSGDIPGNFKRALLQKAPGFPGIERGALDWEPGCLNGREALILTLADRIEAYTFIRTHGFGAHAERVQQRAWASLMDKAAISDGGDTDTGFVKAVRDVIRDILNEVDRD